MHTYRRIIRRALVLAFFAALVVPTATQAGATGVEVTLDDGTHQAEIVVDLGPGTYPVIACVHNVTIAGDGPYTVGVCKP